MRMKSANFVLTLLVVLLFGKLKSQELLDIRCLPEMRPMMINGSNAGRTPWMVYLTQNGMFICGGSLVTERFVLTAAHCASSTNNLTARLGEYNTLTTEDGQHIDIAVINIWKPEDGNDIALLKLSQPVSFTEIIKPICIPFNSDFKTIALVKNQFSVTGWGKTTRRGVGGSATILQEISVQQLHPSRCKSREGQLCFGTSSQNICNGDSGSPLVADVLFYETTITVQFAVVSYGYETCFDHALYVDVNKYVSWIKTLISLNN